MDEVLEDVPAVLVGELDGSARWCRGTLTVLTGTPGGAERLRVAAGGRAQAERVAEIAGETDREAVARRSAAPSGAT